MVGHSSLHYAFGPCTAEANPRRGGMAARTAGSGRVYRLSEGLARCFTDLRVPEAVTHTVPDLLRQRIFAIALGHED